MHLGLRYENTKFVVIVIHSSVRLEIQVLHKHSSNLFKFQFSTLAWGGAGGHLRPICTHRGGGGDSEMVV